MPPTISTESGEGGEVREYEAHRDPSLSDEVRLAALMEARPDLAVSTPLGPDHYPHGDPGDLAMAEPLYSSWQDYLKRTTVAQRRAWCESKARTANRTRLMSAAVDVKLTAADVWAVLERAEGRCAHCGSLAVERCPTFPSGKIRPWAAIGRRIGSLGHRATRYEGGANGLDNLEWNCWWCNTWESERRPGARDHGGHYPDDDQAAILAADAKVRK